MPPRLLPQGWEVRMGTRLPRPPRLQGSTDLSRYLLGRVPGVPEDPSLPDPHPHLRNLEPGHSIAFWSTSRTRACC